MFVVVFEMFGMHEVQITEWGSTKCHARAQCSGLHYIHPRDIT